ncbi:hypothetical protein [Deinococcus hopiensis]|uniref:Uncharacterized protein n=1 Tax=Deinococcus hopiensis KR-140 TaxID=695939 RepID=A0A1W1UXF9_9DEIO|nr:hypothetical protein [Deinococcus hopiensis]SMB85757.1 hypothetical protein SAMN00790413_03527 [Deinococcus hopiensis KR-140]
MSLELKLRDLITRLGTEFKAVRTTIGTLASLTTTDKTNLVAALNELRAQVLASTQIDDSSVSASKTYSSQKTEARISAAISALVNGAPTALDTLKELVDQLAADESGLAALTTAVGNRVRFDAAQVLTAGQQAQARDNIGAQAAAAIGDTERDLVADFNAALAP